MGREQTHLSLRQHLLEEAYETLEAAMMKDMKACVKVGDLLLQIVLHAQIATEEGDFNMTDVLSGIVSNSSAVIRMFCGFGC